MVLHSVGAWNFYGAMLSVGGCSSIEVGELSLSANSEWRSRGWKCQVRETFSLDSSLLREENPYSESEENLFMLGSLSLRNGQLYSSSSTVIELDSSTEGLSLREQSELISAGNMKIIAPLSLSIEESNCMSSGELSMHTEREIQLSSRGRLRGQRALTLSCEKLNTSGEIASEGMVALRYQKIFIQHAPGNIRSLEKILLESQSIQNNSVIFADRGLVEISFGKHCRNLNAIGALEGVRVQTESGNFQNGEQASLSTQGECTLLLGMQEEEDLSYRELNQSPFVNRGTVAGYKRVCICANGNARNRGHLLSLGPLKVFCSSQFFQEGTIEASGLLTLHNYLLRNLGQITYRGESLFSFHTISNGSIEKNAFIQSEGDLTLHAGTYFGNFQSDLFVVGDLTLDADDQRGDI